MRDAPGSPVPDELLDELVDDLCTRHGCHTVLLYGSRVAGLHGPESDYDLLAVRATGGSERDARLHRGAYVDAFIYDEPAFAAELDPALLRIRGGVVLREHGDFGARLLARVHEMFARGPKPLPPDEARAVRLWAGKMLERIARGAGEDVTANYRRVELLTQLLQDYFQLRGRWYLGPKESLAWLRAHDDRAHRAFAAALRPDAPLAAIEHLARVVGEEVAPAPV